MTAATLAIPDLPVQKLRELLVSHGPEILGEEERCRGWLRYACPDHKPEVNALLAALEEGIPQALLAGDDRLSLVRRLEESRALTEEAAELAVDKWTAALADRLWDARRETSADVQAICSPGTARRAAGPNIQLPSLRAAVDSDLAEQARRGLLLCELDRTLKAFRYRQSVRQTDPQIVTVCLGVVMTFVSLAAVAAAPLVGLALIALSAGAIWSLYRFCASNHKANLAEAQSLLDQIIARTKVDFPQELGALGGPDSIENAQTVEELIRVVRSSQAATNRPLLQQHRGHLILALGLLGWFVPLLAVFAWGMGAADVKAMDAGTMDPAGRRNTDSGRKLGAAATVICVGLIVLAFLVWATK